MTRSCGRCAVGERLECEVPRGGWSTTTIIGSVRMDGRTESVVIEGVFVDESGANTQMTQLRGRSLVGEPLLAHAPRGHYHSNTLVAAVRAEGAFAPCIFDGPMNGESFLAWVGQLLVPCLRKGDVVVLDNLTNSPPPAPCDVTRRASSTEQISLLGCKASPRSSCKGARDNGLLAKPR